MNSQKRKSGRNRIERPSVADRILQGLQEVADALKSGEDLTKRFKVRKLYFDLVPQTHNSKGVKKIRNLLGVDQNVFGQLLGVPASTIRSWEEGTKVPNATASRFLDEIQRNPGYWTTRLTESVVSV